MALSLGILALFIIKTEATRVSSISVKKSL